MHNWAAPVIILLLLGAGTAGAQNAKMKTIEVPRFGLSFNFPRETVQKKLTDSTAQYYFEILDTRGKNIGTGESNFYPQAANISENDLLAQVKAQVADKGAADSYELLSTERKILKGVYQLIILKSVYRFKNNNFSIGREDYLYLGCKGIAHIMFTVPSTNCYVTEDDRFLLTHNFFKWYFKNVRDRNLQISYNMPVGVFRPVPHADKKGIAFRSCVKDYLTEADLYKLDAGKGGLDTVAKAWFAKAKKAGAYNIKSYQPVAVKNRYIAQSYNSKIKGIEYLVYEYIFKCGGHYFAAVVKSTCSDMDGCGNAQFTAEIEKMLDSVTAVEEKKNSEDEEWDLWGL